MTDQELMKHVANLLADWPTEGTRAVMSAHFLLRERLAQPDPEPVAFGYLWPTGMHPEFRYTQQKRGGIDGTPVYTAPPRRKWQGLTEPELHEINPTWPNPGEPWEYENMLAFARAIEDALKEKNT